MSPVPAWSIPEASLYTGDAVETLDAWPAESIDCVVTSPPYYGLRDYGTGHWVGDDPACAHSVGRGSNTAQPIATVDYPASPAHRGGDPQTCHRCGAIRVDQQYGLEPTPQDYVDNLRALFAQLRRALKPTGTVWLNLGDSYSAEPPGRSKHAMRRSTLTGAAAAGTLREQVRSAGVDRTHAVPRKNLLGMPWRVALALQADGWVLRNAVVWAKRNPMPESVKDRLSATYEFVFLLTANSTYYFDLDAIRVPLRRPEALGEAIPVGGPRVTEGALLGASARRRGRSVYGDGQYRDSTAFARGGHGAATLPTGRRHERVHPRGKNPGDVWQMATRPLREAHFATFPVDLPLRCIAAGCPPGGVVLDPLARPPQAWPPSNSADATSGSSSTPPTTSSPNTGYSKACEQKGEQRDVSEPRSAAVLHPTVWPGHRPCHARLGVEAMSCSRRSYRKAALSSINLEGHQPG